LREVSPGSQRLFIPVSNEPKRRNYPSDTLPALLPDMMNVLLTKSFEKTAAEGMGSLTQTIIGRF